MPTSFESSDILNSDADGSYNISFFASSIRHTKGLSQGIFAKFAGGRFSEKAQPWKEATDQERKAFLLEHHEAAHHGLLFSTPAGALLWRLNQVLSRDIHYISTTLRQLGIPVPLSPSPRKWLTSEGFAKALDHQAFAHVSRKSYLLSVINAVEKLHLFKQVFFEADSPRHHAEMTMGELVALSNFVYPYLSERCGINSCITWTTKLEPSTKVFPPGKTFNVMDIAECHAIAKELFILRGVSDSAGFQARLDEATHGQFGECLQRAIEIAKFGNEIGFSPHTIQMSAVIACCAIIDVSQNVTNELCLEDLLPWWKYTPEILTVESIKHCVKSLTSLYSQPLIGPGSRWLTFYPVSFHASRPEQISEVLQTLASFGLEIQIHLIHKGAHNNLMFVMESIKHWNEPTVSESAFDSWNEFLFLNQAFIEYSDSIFYRRLDLAAVYGEGHPIRQLPGFDLLELPWLQLLGHIINGAVARRAMAAYNRLTIPRADVIARKLETLFLEYQAYFPKQSRGIWHEHATLLSSLVGELFDKGRDLPFGIEYVRQISQDRFI